MFVRIMMNNVIYADNTSTASTDVQVSSLPKDKSAHDMPLLKALDVSAAVVKPIALKRSADRLAQDGVKQQKTSLNLQDSQKTPESDEPPFQDKGVNPYYTGQYV